LAVNGWKVPLDLRQRVLAPQKFQLWRQDRIFLQLVLLDKPKNQLGLCWAKKQLPWLNAKAECFQPPSKLRCGNGRLWNRLVWRQRLRHKLELRQPVVALAVKQL